MAQGGRERTTAPLRWKERWELTFMSTDGLTTFMTRTRALAEWLSQGYGSLRPPGLDDLPNTTGVGLWSTNIGDSILEAIDGYQATRPRRVPSNETRAKARGLDVHDTEFPGGDGDS